MTENQKRLLSSGIVEITNEVNGQMVEYIHEATLWLYANKTPKIKVIIASGGGDAACGLAIYDILSIYPNEITGVVVTCARSMAAVILQACTVRKATLHAKILIHHISRRSVSLDVLRDKKKLGETRVDMEKNQRQQYIILSQRTGKDIKTIRSVCKKNEDMTAEEAIEFGLIDEIEPKAKIGSEATSPEK